MTQRIADRDEQPVGVERLLEEVECAATGGLDRCLQSTVTRDHDHDRVRVELPQPREGVETVQAGHLDVEERQVGPVLGEEGDAFTPGARRPHLHALILEHLLEGLADACFVIDNEYPISHASNVTSRAVNGSRADLARPLHLTGAAASIEHV